MKYTSASLHSQLPSLLVDPAELENLMTPLLAIYPDIVDSNIKVTLGVLNGKTDRWQPHLKTAKLSNTMKQFCQHGVKQFKCATTLEMLIACQAGAKEVLLSYPSMGTRARRVREIATMYPQVRISATIEDAEQVKQWKGSSVALYIDINPGMNRTGIDQKRIADIVALATSIRREGIEFMGLHYYDGHNRQPDLEERKAAAYPGYEQLLRIAESVRETKIQVDMLITSGTPALPCAASFPGFRDGSILHRVSSGTVVYGDLLSASQLPEEWGYRFGALVIASVISHPTPGLITCDAGHKAVSSDAGLPNCTVLGHPELEPQRPSEEHLPIRVPEGVPVPGIGEILYLVPKHICPTVNNFDLALLVRNRKIIEIARVSARGRESQRLAVLPKR
jgi:D-serine deaminase-like pyridoxal phosphate-dependent protein